MAKKDETTDIDYIPPSERQAEFFEGELKKYLENNCARFLRDENGALHIILNGRRILLNYDRNNEGIAWLMLEACKVSTLSVGAQSAIQRLQVYASDKADKIRFRRFSGVSEDAKRVYIPIEDGKLLLITNDQIRCVNNGENDDSLWIEHPNDDPLRYSPMNPKAGTELFEELLVETQTCRIPEMRWFAAMQEGLFPYIRDCYSARLILVHIGASQQGKTTGTVRFILLHGLRDHQGNYSVAALRNLGDIGLIVLDNKEQANFDQELVDFCLFLATGAELGRSYSDGRLRTNRARPVGVITSIEGIHKQELQKRSIEIEHEIIGAKLGREHIQREIKENRHKIRSSLIRVLQEYLRIKEEGKPTPNPMPDFEENFRALCDLLRAFEVVAEKPAGWAERIITVWDYTIKGREVEENELEHPIYRILECAQQEGVGRIDIQATHYNGKKGKLYVTECSIILAEIQKLNLRNLPLPRTVNALGRRLRSSVFRSFTLLDADIAPDLEILKRTAKRRPIGLFIGDD